MISVLNEIARLRNGTSLFIDYENSNRYRVVAIESNGSKTAYYFTAPIYNNRTRKAVDMKFHSKDDTVYAVGSNTNIAITDSIRMENGEGSCIISLANRVNRISEHELICENEKTYPTTNGVAIKSACREGKPFSFSIEVSKPFLAVRANNKYFALMSEKFRPFVSISCIGTSDADGNIISPAKIAYQKITDRKFTLTVLPCSSLGKSVVIEANLYEAKLMQDTTVESKNPKMNNVFGSIGFIGSTKEYGEQWLYARPDFSKMRELNDKRILRAVLHLPRLNNASVEIAMSRVAARFCSFGSNWNNKISEASLLADSKITDHYIDLNLMPIISDERGRLLRDEGFILKAKKKNCGFSVIATGDSYLMPQIIEINYK